VKSTVPEGATAEHRACRSSVPPCVFALALYIVSGCAAVPATRRPTSEPTKPPRSEARVRPDRREVAATAALQKEAQFLEEQEQFERAAATLERALRIEPRNPYLWNRLAALRLRQNKADQAESLARKSNLLAGSDARLRAQNWKIVAAALRVRGDETGARIAEQEAGRSAR